MNHVKAFKHFFVIMWKKQVCLLPVTLIQSDSGSFLNKSHGVDQMSAHLFPGGSFQTALMFYLTDKWKIAVAAEVTPQRWFLVSPAGGSRGFALTLLRLSAQIQPCCKLRPSDFPNVWAVIRCHADPMPSAINPVSAVVC